jgi:hypothetical protein
LSETAINAVKNTVAQLSKDFPEVRRTGNRDIGETSDLTQDFLARFERTPCLRRAHNTVRSLICMTVTLNQRSDEEAALLAKAQTSGMSVGEYLHSLIECTNAQEMPGGLPLAERAAAFESWSANHRVTAPPLSDEAVSRESMYQGREQ